MHVFITVLEVLYVGVLYLGVFYVPNSTTESHPQPHYFSPLALASVHLGQAALSWISQQEPHSEL